MGPAPTAPLTEAGEMPSLSGLTEASEYLLEQYVNTTVLPWTGDEFRDILAIIEGDAIARHREQADAEVALLRAEVDRLRLVLATHRAHHEGMGRLVTRYQQCDTCAAYRDYLAALATRPPTPSPEQGGGE